MLFAEELVAGDFPEVDFAGPVAAGEVLTVGADDEAIDRFVVGFPLAEDLIAIGIEPADDALLAGREEVAAIGSIGQSKYRAIVPTNDPDHAADVWLPDANGLVRAG